MKSKEYLAKYQPLIAANDLQWCIKITEDLFDDFLELLNKSKTITVKAFVNTCNAFETKFGAIKELFQKQSLPFPEIIWETMKIRINARYGNYFSGKKYYRDVTTKSSFYTKTEYQHQEDEKRKREAKEQHWEQFFDFNNLDEVLKFIFNQTGAKFGNDYREKFYNSRQHIDDETYNRIPIINYNQIEAANRFFGCDIRNMTFDQIKKLRNKMMVKNHPDKGGNEEIAKQINIYFDICKIYFETINKIN